MHHIDSRSCGSRAQGGYVQVIEPLMGPMTKSHAMVDRPDTARILSGFHRSVTSQSICFEIYCLSVGNRRSGRGSRFLLAHELRLRMSLTDQPRPPSKLSCRCVFFNTHLNDSGHCRYVPALGHGLRAHMTAYFSPHSMQCFTVRNAPVRPAYWFV